MEDKRVRKTKKHLKQTLIQMLSNKPFERITVTELCNAADISRITFYVHYDDKYALADEIFLDMLSLARTDFYRLQQENNTACDPIMTYCNLLDCILNLYYDNAYFFKHTTPSKNPYLYYTFYGYITDSVETRLERERSFLAPKYSPKMISAFLCNGLWGFINEGREGNFPSEEVRSDVKALLKDLLQTEVLTSNC